MTDEEIKLNAVAIAEGWYSKEPTKEEEIKAWQHLIDTGMCWQLQGWFGRMAVWHCKTGNCKPSQLMINQNIGGVWVEQEKEQIGSEKG